MELITFIQPINNGDALEFKLNNQMQIHYLTNVDTYFDKIYKYKKPVKGSENARFKILYNGNKTIITDVEQEVVHYVLLKEKEASKHLIQVDVFEQLFQEA